MKNCGIFGFSTDSGNIQENFGNQGFIQSLIEFRNLLGPSRDQTDIK